MQLLKRVLLNSFCLFLFVSLGCTTVVETPAYPEDLRGQVRVLPVGKYEQTLDFLLSSKRALRFGLQVELKSSEVKIQGFKPNRSKPAFFIFENTKTGQAKLTVFDDNLEAYRDKLEQVYMRLRPVLFVGKDKGMNRTSYRSYDANGVPRKIEIAGSDLKLAIEVDSYDLY